MQFAERADGDYRIQAGSIELRVGHGFMAAVIVSLVGKAGTTRHEVHRDIAICGGHPWMTSDLALQQAFLQGDRVVKADKDQAASQSLVSATTTARVV